MPEGAPAPERMGHRYPLLRTNDRTLPAYKGPLYLWDIDNTYLMTEWSSLRDLIRIRFEAAIDKRPVAGAPEDALAARNVRKPDIDYVCALAQELPERDPVDLVVIRRVRPLERAPGDEPGIAAQPAPFDADDARVKLVQDYGEAAALLYVR